jgi:hypothetical protein
MWKWHSPSRVTVHYGTVLAVDSLARLLEDCSLGITIAHAYLLPPSDVWVISAAQWTPVTVSS